MAKDYAIVPEEEVLKLKRDVEQIKKNPFQAYATDDFIESVNNLSKAINSLINLFSAAAEEMKLEERETETIGRKMDPLFAKIDMLVDQNQKIARGIVAVADMLSTGKPAWREEQPAPVQQQMQPRPMMMQGPSGPMAPQRMPSMAPQMGQRPQMGPPSVPAPPSPGMPMPPMPVKKKGLFG